MRFLTALLICPEFINFEMNGSDSDVGSGVGVSVDIGKGTGVAATLVWGGSIDGVLVPGVSALVIVGTGKAVRETVDGKAGVETSVDGGGVDVGAGALLAIAIIWSRSLNASGYFDSSVRIFALSYLVAGFLPLNSIALLYASSAASY